MQAGERALVRSLLPPVQTGHCLGAASRRFAAGRTPNTHHCWNLKLAFSMGRRTESPANAVILMRDVQHGPVLFGERIPGLAQSARKKVPLAILGICLF